MVKEQKQKEPGEVFRIPGFSVTKLLILVGMAIILTILFYEYGQLRTTIVFGASALGVAGAIYSALLASENLQGVIKHRQLDFSFGYMVRWNDPAFSKLKHRWREILEVIRGRSPEDIEKLLNENKEDRTTAVDVLNFFEEMAIAIKFGTADELILREAFHGIIIDYYSTAEPWIERHRAAKARPRFLCELEELRDKWK